jgi:hypothetical protein
LYIKEILTSREACMGMAISPSVVHSLMYEKSENGIGNPTQKRIHIYLKNTWKKGRVAESTLPPKIPHVCLKASYPSSCAEKQIYSPSALNSVCNKLRFHQLPLRNLNPMILSDKV